VLDRQFCIILNILEAQRYEHYRARSVNLLSRGEALN